MLENKYNRLVLKKVESNLDIVLPAGSIACLISALAILFSKIPLTFFVIDVLFGICLLIMAIFRREIPFKVKLYSVLAMPGVLGVMSFLDGAFESAGNILLLFTNVIAALFMERKQSIRVAILTTVTFFSLWIITENEWFGTYSSATHTEWVIQLAVFLLFVIFTHIVLYSIREHLVDNIIELESTVTQVNQLAYFDMLTMLWNKNNMLKHLTERMHDGVKSGTLVIVSITNLNVINAVHSMKTGDLVLIEVSRILQYQNNRNKVARVSGNEFAIWIEGLSDEVLEYELNRIQERIKSEVRVQQMQISVECRMTYAKYKTGMDILDCYQKANVVMTYAKHDNNVGIVAYDEEIKSSIRYREKLKELIIDAVENKSFQVFYQNQVQATSEKIIGVEALARWKHPMFGWIAPTEFIPVVDSIGLAVDFGEMMIDKVFQDMELLNRQNKEPVKVSINLSPNHLSSERLLPYLEKMIQKYQIDTHRITFEITEDVFIEEGEQVNEILQELRKLGFKIALDDFGTGYSSFYYLTVMELDELKIDKSIVDQIESNHKAKFLLKSILNVADGLLLEVVAEGVESEEQCKTIVEMGCDIIQGFYYSKPIPLEKEPVATH